MAKVNHLVVGTNYVVLLDDLYQSIGTICGIQRLDPAQPLPTGDSVVDIAILTSNGHLRRTKIQSTIARNIGLIYMTPANFTKINQLVGLTYNGLIIKKAYFAGLPIPIHA